MRLALCLCLVLAAVACERSKTQPAAAPAPPAAMTKPPAKIARIVFIDKEHACDCTRKRTDDAWAALQAALGASARPVERIHVDTQATQAGAYTAAKPLMVPPGIYLVDAANTVIDMLQGEVTTAQIAAALQAR
jgi:hypothetical protein